MKGGLFSPPFLSVRKGQIAVIHEAMLKRQMGRPFRIMVKIALA